MFKFVGDGIDSGQKRQQASKACEPCRRRKKRCTHLPPGQKTQRARRRKSVNEDISERSHTASKIATGEAPYVQDTTESPGPCDGFKVRGSPDAIDAAPSENTHDLQADSSNAGSRSAIQPVLPDTRFIGDSNPEGVFLAATCPTANRGTSINGSIGVW